MAVVRARPVWGAGGRLATAALSRSDGLTRPVPAATFLVALGLSMGGLGYAMRTLPVGTSYAVWVGIGAVLTVVVAMVTRRPRRSRWSRRCC